MARRIGSVALTADSVDFLEDASVNAIILLALRLSLAWRARIGMALAGLLMVPAIVTLATAIDKLADPVPPDALQLSVVAVGSLVVNLGCAFLLARFRKSAGSLTQAAFLASRNDAIASLTVLATGLLTAYAVPSAWPDLVVGIGILALNADAASHVFRAARREHDDLMGLG